MDTVIVAALIGFISAVITSLISHGLLLGRIRREAMEPFRSEFYQKQLMAYQKMWSLLGPTSRYPSDNTVIIRKNRQQYLSVVNARKFSNDIREFFFSEYGIFLSKEMRKSIFEMLDDLAEHKYRGGSEDNLVPLTKEQASSIQVCFANIHVTARRDLALSDIAFPKSELGLEE